MTMKRVARSLSIGAISVLSATTIVFPAAVAQPLPSSWFDAIILRPVRFPSGNYAVREVDGIKYTDVFFPSQNGRLLHAWYFKQPHATKTILLSHGIGGNISSRIDLIQLFLKAGTNVFIYDYEGYGRSEGKASLKNVVGDGMSAYKYVTNDLGVSPSTLVLAGESLGTGVTCNVSKHVKAAALILQSPFSSLARRCAEVVPFLRHHPTWLQPTSALNNDDVLRDPHPPLLIVHGDRDQTVPVSHALRLYDDAVGPKELVVIDGAGHTGDPLLMYSREYFNTVKTFLDQLPTITAHNHAISRQPVLDALN